MRIERYQESASAQVESAEASSTDSRLVDLSTQSRRYFAESKASSTRRAYRSDWDCFVGFCAERHLLPLPAFSETVCLYLTELADSGKKVSTINRRLCAISQAHQLAGYESPTKSAMVRTLMAGVRRTLGTAQTGKSPLLSADIRAMLAQLPDNRKGIRDRALLLIGFAGGLRRAELAGLNVEDITFTEEGIIVLIRRSKTDQEGAGQQVGVPHGNHIETCPVAALKAWLEASEIGSGGIFRPMDRHGRIHGERLSGNGIALVIKEHCRRIGLSPDRFAGHSLRAGLATQAAASGASERSIQNQTRHRSLITLRKYIRHGSLFRENAASTLGL